MQEFQERQEQRKLLELDRLWRTGELGELQKQHELQEFQELLSRIEDQDISTINELKAANNLIKECRELQIKLPNVRIIF